MSILLRRLIGGPDNLSIADEVAGMTKLPVEPLLAAFYLDSEGWAGAPTFAELDTIYGFSGQAFDPTDDQVTDSVVLRGLTSETGDAHRSIEEIAYVFRSAETMPELLTETRVQQLLGGTWT